MKDKEISIPETEECTLAHVDYETQRIESMQEHAGNVALFLSNVCELPELKNLVELAGILHDAGKLGTKNQDDFKINGKETKQRDACQAVTNNKAKAHYQAAK